MKKLKIILAAAFFTSIISCQKEDLKQKEFTLNSITSIKGGFKPGDPINYGKVKDIDGNSYKTVMIGDQEWMAQNLQVTRYRNGDQIQNILDNNEWQITSKGSWCYFNNDQANNSVYGKLYNFYAISDPRGIAPKGWHVASHEEWITLTNYLGGDAIAGGSLKSTGTINEGTGLWYSPNNGATNICGFSGLPGGARFYNGIFSTTGPAGIWWTSTIYDANSAWSKVITHGETNVGSFYSGSYLTNGLSIRCVKD